MSLDLLPTSLGGWKALADIPVPNIPDIPDNPSTTSKPNTSVDSVDDTTPQATEVEVEREGYNTGAFPYNPYFSHSNCRSISVMHGF